MKCFISALFLFAALCARSQTQIAWDMPASTGVTGYIIYAHTNSLSSANLGAATIKAVLPSPSQLTMTLNITNTTTAPIRWFVVAVATYTTGSSPPSNQLVIDLAPPVAVLAPPTNLRVLP